MISFSVTTLERARTMTRKRQFSVTRTSLKTFAVAITPAVLTLGSVWASVELAKVNGKPITESDLARVLSGMNDGQRSNVLKDPATRKQILTSVIDQEILVQEGEKLKLDQSQAYKDALANFRRQYLMGQVLERGVGGKLTDATARKYYEANKRRFSTDQVHVQHILTSDEMQARELLKKAKEAGADFQELAEKHSKDPSAKNNRGDIGPINRDSPFVQEFKDAAFDGKKGEIIGPVKTAFGFHLIRIVDKKLGRPLEYDEVELKVKGELREALIKDYVSQLKRQAKVQIL